MPEGELVMFQTMRRKALESPSDQLRGWHKRASGQVDVLASAEPISLPNPRLTRSATEPAEKVANGPAHVMSVPLRSEHELKVEADGLAEFALVCRRQERKIVRQRKRAERDYAALTGRPLPTEDNTVLANLEATANELDGILALQKRDFGKNVMSIRGLEEKIADIRHNIAKLREERT